MRRLGANVVVVDEPDANGGHLAARLREVARRCAADPTLVWTDQYRNPANPRAHELGTARELWSQVHGPAAVLVPVSTGGCLAGISQFARKRQVPWTVIGVDVLGSAALGPATGRRALTGIGASRQSSFLRHPAPGLRVPDAEAVGMCLWLLHTAGIGVGASSGAVLAAAVRHCRANPDVDRVVCVCADGADRYVDTVWSSDWRARQGVEPVGPDIELVSVGRPVEPGLLG